MWAIDGGRLGDIMRSMQDQLDLFSSGTAANAAPTDAARRPALDVASLDDSALVPALQACGSRDAILVVGEIGRRQLSAAIPALEHFCRLYAAYGIRGVSREQEAALDALTQIGGADATRAVTRLIERGEVQGEARKKAVRIAAEQGGALPIELLESILQVDDPALRRDGCRLARRWPSLVPLLVGLLDDIDSDVQIAAACALGDMGWQGARPLLLRLLRSVPSSEVIDTVVGVADEQCIVELGRLARSETALAAAALAALQAIDHPLAEKLVERLAGMTAPR